MQVMPEAEAWDYRYNPFDLTKVWPHGDYPLHEIGKLVLDRNPDNFFAETEQSAFEPGNMVPGIEPSPGQDAAEPVDLLRGRAPVPDRHQLRAHADQLPDPRRERHPEPGRQDHGPTATTAGARTTRRTASTTRSPTTPTTRAPTRSAARSAASTTSRSTRTPTASSRPRSGTCSTTTRSERLVGNIAGHLGEVTHEDVRKRALEYLAIASQDLSDRVAAAMDAPHEVGSPTS